MKAQGRCVLRAVKPVEPRPRAPGSLGRGGAGPTRARSGPIGYGFRGGASEGALRAFWGGAEDGARRTDSHGRNRWRIPESEGSLAAGRRRGTGEAGGGGRGPGGAGGRGRGRGWRASGGAFEGGSTPKIQPPWWGRQQKVDRQEGESLQRAGRAGPARKTCGVLRGAARRPLKP